MVKKEWYKLSLEGAPYGNLSDLSLSFEDRAGTHSDKITITAPPNYTKPKPYAKMELTFFNDSGDVLKCGTFYVQAVSRIDNKSLKIVATAIKFNSKQKDKKSHHYQNTKLSSVVKLVSKRLGYKVKFSSKDTTIKSLYQTNESDINFLYRLAEEHNSLFSVKNKVVYFVDRDDKNLPVTIVDITKAKSSTITHTAKTFYKSCEATFYDSKLAKDVKVRVGSGEPLLKIKGSYKDKAEARLKAQKKLGEVLKGVVRGDLVIKGKKIYAGTMLKLLNTYNNEDDKKFYIKSCKHTFSRAHSWQIEVEFEK